MTELNKKNIKTNKKSELGKKTLNRGFEIESYYSKWLNWDKDKELDD